MVAWRKLRCAYCAERVHILEDEEIASDVRSPIRRERAASDEVEPG